MTFGAFSIPRNSTVKCRRVGNWSSWKWRRKFGTKTLNTCIFKTSCWVLATEYRRQKFQCASQPREKHAPLWEDLYTEPLCSGVAGLASATLHNSHFCKRKIKGRWEPTFVQINLLLIPVGNTHLAWKKPHKNKQQNNDENFEMFVSIDTSPHWAVYPEVLTLIQGCCNILEMN